MQLILKFRFSHPKYTCGSLRQICGFDFSYRSVYEFLKVASCWATISIQWFAWLLPVSGEKQQWNGLQTNRFTIRFGLTSYSFRQTDLSSFLNLANFLKYALFDLLFRVRLTHHNIKMEITSYKTVLINVVLPMDCEGPPNILGKSPGNEVEF